VKKLWDKIGGILSAKSFVSDVSKPHYIFYKSRVLSENTGILQKELMPKKRHQGEISVDIYVNLLITKLFGISSN
jgi:hypothetical protein